MYRSSEVRWFFAGELPADVREWFVVGDHVRGEPVRTDEYILLPDCRTVSLKIREGRLEVKARTLAPEPVTYAHDVKGMRDNWVKWSSNTVAVEALEELVSRADERRLIVTKHRRLRTYSLHGEAPEEVDGSVVRLEDGCQIELTEISVSWAHPRYRSNVPDEEQASSTWWTLSFEAFGAPERITANLDRVMTLIFRSAPPMQLPRDASRSYPAWLAMIAARQ